MQHGDHPQPEVLQIYTDGSYDGTKCGETHVGWGFAAFVGGPGGFRLEHMAYGCILDDSCPLVHGFPVPLNARTGEIEALIQATIWSLTHLGYYPVEIYYDAISVGHAGTGQWNFPKDDKHAKTLRALMQYVEMYHDQGFTGHHVKAHTGILGNEVANFLAQFARMVQTTAGTSEIDLGRYVIGERMPIEWLWMRLVPYNMLEEAYPHLSQGQIEANGPLIVNDASSAFPAQLQENSPQVTKLVYANFFVATYNVGSLQRVRGQPANEGLCLQEYLRKQAQAHGITCLMLQETRARQTGVIISDTHIRLVAACDQGKGGTEIWLAKRSSTGKKLGINKEDILVMISEPELLCARVRWQFGHYLLVSAHSPHSGSGVDVITDWWTRLSELLTRLHRAEHEWLVIGIDANTNFETDSHPHIGTYGLVQRENAVARNFKALLHKHDLYLPSTFEEQHTGGYDTWRVASDKPGARCDYICLPVSWVNSKIHSLNLPDLDAGTSTFDHTAVGAWCQTTFHKQHRPRQAIDTGKIQCQLEQNGHELIPQLQAINWNCDVHQHSAQIADITTEWLTAHCGRGDREPRADYITSETWEIRQVRLTLARSLKSLAKFAVHHQLRMALLAWNTSRPLQQIQKDGFHVSWTVVTLRRQLLQAIRWSRSILKQRLRQDRTHYLEGVATQALADHPSALYRHLRSIGVRGKSKRQPMQPLPCLRNLQGELVTTFEQWAETWRQQFEKQEDGCSKSRAALLASCLVNQAWDRNHDALASWDQIPTLIDFERSLRQTNTNKAFFDDGTPGELLHYGAHLLAPVLYPLLLKQWLFHREAITFKGGLLVAAFKKGDPMDTNNYTFDLTHAGEVDPPPTQG